MLLLSKNMKRSSRWASIAYILAGGQLNFMNISTNVLSSANSLKPSPIDVGHSTNFMKPTNFPSSIIWRHDSSWSGPAPKAIYHGPRSRQIVISWQAAQDYSKLNFTQH